VRVAYDDFSSLADALGRAGETAARTLVIDVEPLIAFWDTGQEILDTALALAGEQAAELPDLRVRCFATNSGRRPAAVPRSGELADGVPGGG
jgi:hypothetical protein